MTHQNFGADVSWTPVLVRQEVVRVVVENDGIFQRLKFQFGSGRKKSSFVSVNEDKSNKLTYFKKELIIQ
jgi:hypothetical protein